MKNQNLKILPLLIAVSLLSFSVRLVDVVSGVSSLSGSAYAKSKGEEEKKDKKKAKDEHKGDDSGDKDHGGSDAMDDAGGHESEDSGHDDLADLDEEEPKWRDAKDEDPAYEMIKEDLYSELLERRKELDQKETNLQTRESLLKAAGQELDRKYQELVQLKGEIEALLNAQSEGEQARIRSLVKIYEGMKPKQAARIFDTLDLDVLVSVVSGMSERKLSPVLAAMNPERAQTITIMLAEEGKLPSFP